MARATGARAGTARSALRLEYVSDDGARRREESPALLEIHYGELDVEPRAETLAFTVPLEPLTEIRVERWIVDATVKRTHEREFELATGGDLLAGVTTAVGDSVESDTRRLYEQMLRLVRERGFHLLRVWNVIPDLHAKDGGLDRYMCFCRGRAEALEAVWGPRFAERLCAVTAVGSARGPQTLYFLASRFEGTPRENPRQVPAWRYPARYGPRSPSFARALRAPDSLGGMLFVSGTASIVGHESRHAEDVEAQTRESLHNVRALLDGETIGVRAATPARFGPVKVYLPRPADRERVMPLLDAELAASTPVLCVRADLCRPELLVEIEGIGGPDETEER